MVTRDLRFNIFADDKASAAFARISAACETLSSRLTGLDRQTARPKIEADTKPLEAKIAQAEAKLDELNRKRTDPRIDADIALAQAKMVEITTKLQELDKKKVKPEVQANIAQAEAKIAELQAKLEALGKKNSSPVVTIQTALANQQIAQLRSAIDAMVKDANNHDPAITLDIAKAEAQLVKLRGQIEDLGRLKSSPKVDADIAAAEAKILALKAQLAELNRNGIKLKSKEAERDANSLLGVLASIGRSLLGSMGAAAVLARNIKLLAVPVSLLNLIPAIASLGDTLVTATQALFLLPAAAGFAAAALGTLAFAFNGLKAAIGPRDTDKQIEKADLALSRLGKSAQEVAKQVIALKPAWNDLKKAVQDSVFENLGKTLGEIAKVYLPVLKNGFTGIGHELNLTAKDLGSFFSQANRVDDVTRQFALWQLTMGALRPGLINITAALTDMGVVGGSFLPGLATAFSNVTAKFADFIAKARASGDLSLWIAQGVVALKEMGTLVGNLGGVLGATFEAARKSGSSFVETVNVALSTLKDFLNTGQGQAGLIALFQGIRQAVDSLMPGLKALFGAVADSFVILQPALQKLGAGISAFAIALAPTVPIVAQLAADIAGPLATAVTFLSNTFGGILPTVLSLALAFKGFTAFGALFLGLGATVSALANKISLTSTAGLYAANATNNFGSALSRVGNSLPLIGAAVVGVMLAYEAFSSKSDELASKVVKGSMSMGQAIAAEQAQVEKNVLIWGLGLNQKDEYAKAANRVRDATYAELQALDPLARAQADVTIAEGLLNDALREHGERSYEAGVATDVLKGAKERLTTATEKHANMTRTDTEAIIANASEMAAAANADVALERAKIGLEQQTIRTTEALKTHTAKSLEGRTALVDLMDANLRVAEAAQRKAEADGKATGAANVAQLGAQAYAGALINLAATATGPTRDALLTMIANLDTTRNGSNNAALAAAGLKDDILKIPGASVTQFSQPGMPNSIADAKRLKDEVNGLQDKSIRVNVDGTLTALTNHIAQGGKTVATGGILPGYTPGVDVHNFASPTAGLLSLSGGEAVMRPEWTRAVGADWVNAANAAARVGGIGGVSQFLARVAPRPNEGEGVRGDGSTFATGGILKFADGGVVNRNVAMGGKYKWTGESVTSWFERTILAVFKARGGPALDWARSQVGKPYIWGGVGPAGYDCSGFMSAIVNVMRGKNPYSRVGATGNFPWGGFQPGIGPGLSIGSTNDAGGGIGHMAGTLNGTNVESSGGVGVRVGGGARGASDGLFTTRAHLAFDDGGMAMNAGYLQKLTQRPERILNPNQTESFERLVKVLDSVRGSVPSPQAAMGGGTAVASEVSRLRSDIQLLGETIRAVVRNARPITVEDRSGNPVETGRAVSLAMRL